MEGENTLDEMCTGPGDVNIKILMFQYVKKQSIRYDTAVSNFEFAIFRYVDFFQHAIYQGIPIT